MTTAHAPAPGVSGAAPGVSEADVRAAVAAVTDPELPFLTLADLGIVRGVEVDPAGSVTVTITPTYSGCPAMTEMKSDIHAALTRLGVRDAEVRTQLQPAWTTDWMTDAARDALREHGYSAPGAAPRRADGPIPLTLEMPARALRCPQCGSHRTRTVSEHGSTLCKALYTCADCGEPFEHFKEI